jgi:hypothetical protein
MSWANTTLSTTATIARHEKEIQRQAGYTARWSIYVPTGTTAYFATTDLATCTYAILTYNDKATATVSVSASKITFPTLKYIIQIDLYDVANELLYTFECTEGYGSTLTDTTGAKTITTVTSTGNWTGWLEADTDMSWTDKLNLAKQMLGIDIEIALAERGVVVNELSGQVLLDVVTNPEEFAIASDYLALHLIYLDLSNGGFSELYDTKSKQYRSLYDIHFAKALKVMNLDPALSGLTTTYRAGWSGRVSR